MGENPKRTHHCNEEAAQIPLGNREGVYADDPKSGDLPVIVDSVNEGKVHGYMHV